MTVPLDAKGRELKIGDRVRCVSVGVHHEKEFVIDQFQVNNYGRHMVCIEIDDSPPSWRWLIFAELFEKIEPAAEIQRVPTFAVGDIVHCLVGSGPPGNLVAGNHYSVSFVYPITGGVRLHGSEFDWCPDRFELVKPASRQTQKEPVQEPKWGNVMQPREYNGHWFTRAVALDMAEVGLACLLRPQDGTNELFCPHPKLLKAHAEACVATYGLGDKQAKATKEYMRKVARSLLVDEPWWHRGTLPDFDY